MKTKVLSKEALKAIHAKKPETEEVPTAPVVNNASENPEVEAKVTVTSPETETENFEEKFKAVTSEFAEFKDASVKEVVELESKLEKANASLESLGAAIGGLKEIVAASVHSMRTALDLAEVDLSDMEAEALVSEYKSIEAKLVDTFPGPGPVVPEASGKEKEVKPIETIKDQAAYAGLGFCNLGE